MASGLTIIRDALIENGTIAAVDQPVPAEYSDVALKRLNQIFGEWNTSGLFARFERMQTFAVTTSAQSYTIGAAADSPTFSVTTGRKPVGIHRANWYLSAGSAPHLLYPIQILTWQEYSSLRLPDFSAVWPAMLYYQPTEPNGTLWLWPYPTDITASLQLFWWDQLERITDAEAELLLPDGYESAIMLTLAERTCRPLGRDMPAGLQSDAANARAAIGRSNQKPPRVNTTGNLAEKRDWVTFR